MSDIGWNAKGQDRPIYPLQAVFADDLYFLVKNFTFIFQRDDVQKIFGYETELKQQHFGPEYFSGKVDFEKIKRDRGFLWDQVLAKSTVMKESPQDSQTTLYEVGLDFGIFCRHGVSLFDIQAE